MSLNNLIKKLILFIYYQAITQTQQIALELS